MRAAPLDAITEEIWPLGQAIKREFQKPYDN